MVRLLYWPAPSAFEIKLATELVDEWNQAHPDVQVVMQPLPAGRSSEETLLAAIVAGTTPDICSNILSGTVARMSRASALVPLSDFSDFDAYVTERSGTDNVEQFRSSDGKHYQLPWKSNPQMLMYNKAMFEEQGLAVPRTYSEFLEVAKVLTRDTDGDGTVDQWAVGLGTDNSWFKRFDDVYPLYTAATDGRGLVKDGKVLFDRPEMLRVLTFLREIFQSGYTPRTYFMRNLFMKGRVAMLPGSAPSIPEVDSTKPPGFRYGFLPYPVPDDHQGPAYAFGDIKNMVLFSSTKHPREAWEFMKFLTSAQSDARLIRETGQLPLRKDLLTTSPFKELIQETAGLTDIAERTKYLRGADNSVNLIEVLDIISQALESSAIYADMSPKDGLDRAVKRARWTMEVWQ